MSEKIPEEVQKGTTCVRGDKCQVQYSPILKNIRRDKVN